MFVYGILAFTIHEKILKSYTKIINLKYQLLYGITSLNYLMGHILCQLFKITLNISLKNHEEKTDNPSIKMFVIKMVNIIMFKIKTGYYVQLLTLETIKLLRNTKSKITKDKNGENTSCLEITEVVSVHCNIVNNDY